MITPEKFYQTLKANDINFFVGVPDSLLKDICAYISDNSADNHIIAANEGGAIAIAAGYNISTGKIPLVYMQNSGLGNSINPLLSLADKEVYAIPMILLIGWRGEPNVHDEPQHIKQGKVTIQLLESINMPYFILESSSNYLEIVHKAINTSKNLSQPVAIVVRKSTFESYQSNLIKTQPRLMSREDAIDCLINTIPEKSIIISTTGMLSRELYELRNKYNMNHDRDFLTVGSMGHACQIALGIAISKPSLQVYCLDGDGSMIMHTGNYSIIGQVKPKNLHIVLFNNLSHDSVGGQPTASNVINYKLLAKSFNLNYLGFAKTKIKFKQLLINQIKLQQQSFIEVLIKKGSRSDLGRPKSSPIENKNSISRVMQNE